ncbi:hypothetical protein [Enterocloster bolteae]|uniref:hypothetical protein n=1 Tax=Enterocloster bolteae TaxID=208479 RepID=UPI002A804610|nr:hypothetical protein [Enterocloster bolteae]
MKDNYTAILASYVTYKELYRNGNYRSSYQVLAEFIKYIISVNKLYAFSIGELKTSIENEFGFHLPDAVLKSALKKIDFIIRGVEGNYSVIVDSINVDGVLEQYKDLAENEGSQILEQLVSYVQNEQGCKLDNREKRDLNRAFVTYLIDESNGNRYQEMISSFILKNADNPDMTAYLNSVREGGILYTGLNYNIVDLGSLKNNLTLYLDMEVLFDIYGYNGEIFQQLALDLINLVRDANKKTKKVHLRYFEETKRDIDLFFLRAEEIVKGTILLKDNVAMKAITNGCKDLTDVSDRQADFYHKLQYTYGVLEDEKKSYYGESDYIANLEGIFSEEEKKNPDVETAVRLISHINKLRDNKNYYEYTDAGYIFITETWKTQECSKKIIEKIGSEISSDKRIVGYAISMSMMTNILWYKLNKGFGGNTFPENVNSILKAKIVLSNFITQNVSKTFYKFKEDYKNGRLDERQLAARLLALREKAMKPEEISLDNLEDNLNFDPKYLGRFEEECELHKAKIKQSELVLEDYVSEIEKLKDTIESQTSSEEKQKAESAAALTEKDEIIQSQSIELERYRTEKARKKNREIFIKKIFIFSWRIFIRIIVLAVIGFASYKVAKFVKADAANTVAIIVTVLGIFVGVIDVVRNVYKDIFVKNDTNTMQNSK